MEVSEAITVFKLLRGNPASNMKNLNSRVVQKACDLAIDVLGKADSDYSPVSDIIEGCEKRRKGIPRTNFEAVKDKSVEDFVDWVLYESDFIAKRYINIREGLIKYLKSIEK